MISTSRKFAVIQRTLNLNRETTIRPMISTSDKVAESAGRRSSASQKKLSSAQARMKAAAATGSISLQTRIASATRWIAMIGARRAKPRSASVVDIGRRLANADRNGGIGAVRLKLLDQAGVDETPIETPRLGAP